MSKNLVGKTIRQHYSLVHQLSSSDYGSVYLARDTFSAIGGKYVVRHFCSNYQSEAQLATAQSWFEREAEKLQQLGNHPQIPRVYDFFQEDNEFFIVGEFIDGQNLRQELSEQKHFDRLQVIQLLTDVLSALQFVHKSGYIHGNIKPSSLIRNKFDRRIFLLDFIAIAEKIEPQNINERGEKIEQIIYSSLEYTAPEQANFEPKYSSDIYALGMVAIEAMTGTNPRDLVRDDDLKLRWRDRLVSDYDSHLLDIIEQMVEYEWCDRHEDAAAIIAELEQLNTQVNSINQAEQNSPVNLVDADLKPDSNPLSKSKLLTNNKLLTAVAALGIIGVSTLSFWQFKSARQPELATYENEYVKLKHPINWSKQERDSFSNTSIILTSPKESTSDEFQERVAIIVEESSRPLSLSEYTNQALIQITSLDNTIITAPEPTILDSSDGKFVIYEGLDKNVAVKRKEVWTVNYKQVYTVIYTAEPESFKRFLPQVEQIIESVEIL